MTAKPNYEELEKRVISLTQEVKACRNLQRTLHQAEETATKEGKEYKGRRGKNKRSDDNMP